MFLDGKHGLPLVDINEGDDECQDDGNASNNASDHCTYVDTVAVVVVLFWLQPPVLSDLVAAVVVDLVAAMAVDLATAVAADLAVTVAADLATAVAADLVAALAMGTARRCWCKPL